MFDSSQHNQLPRELQNLIEMELRPGERLVWTGQPIPSRAARSALPAVLFGIPWTAFALFWTAGAAWGTSKTESPGLFTLFPLFGAPFILIGAGMLSSPYWAARASKRSAYVITDRRAIILGAGLWGKMNVRSFEPDQLKGLERNQHKDGSGDVVFSRDSCRDSDGDRRISKVGFMAVADVKQVEEMVRQLASKAGI